MTPLRSSSLAALFALLPALAPSAVPASGPALGPASDSAPSAAPSPEAASGEAQGRPAILLELFTSQGCSSCPPADRLLSRIGEAGELGGVPVVPLAFHVDYWDHIGWKDPFSSAEWSARQRAYGNAFDLYSVYTPQVVVAGRAHTVGSDERRLREIVGEAAAERQAASVGLTLSPAAEGVRVRVEPRFGKGEEEAGAAVAVLVALFESGIETPVRSGENARKTLHEDFIVRRLVALADGEREITLRLDPAWRRDNVGVVAFLQETASLAVLAAERADLTAALPRG